MNKNDKNPISKTKDGKDIYKYHGKEYILVNEINKRGCQGCAFCERIDCDKLGKTKFCIPQKKIFMRYLRHEK